MSTNGKISQLIQYANKGNNKGIRKLLKSGIDVNSLGRGGTTALHWAAYNGNCSACTILLEHCANVNKRDTKGRTALMECADSDKIEGVRFLLTVPGIKHTEEARQLAWNHNYWRIVSLITRFQEGKSISSSDDNRYYVGDNYAEYKGSVLTITDENVYSVVDGETVLHQAQTKAHVDTALRKGALRIFNLRNLDGKTALESTTILEVFLVLYKKHLEISPGFTEFTFNQRLLFTGDSDSARELIVDGADPEYVEETGFANFPTLTLLNITGSLSIVREIFKHKFRGTDNKVHQLIVEDDVNRIMELAEELPEGALIYQIDVDNPNIGFVTAIRMAPTTEILQALCMAYIRKSSEDSPTTTLLKLADTGSLNEVVNFLETPGISGIEKHITNDIFRTNPLFVESGFKTVDLIHDANIRKFLESFFKFNDVKHWHDPVKIKQFIIHNLPVKTIQQQLMVAETGEQVVELIARCADPNLRTVFEYGDYQFKGYSPLEWAEKEDVVRALFQAGAKMCLMTELPIMGIEELVRIDSTPPSAEALPVAEKTPKPDKNVDVPSPPYYTGTQRSVPQVEAGCNAGRNRNCVIM